jgi:proline iminopeptidase
MNRKKRMWLYGGLGALAILGAIGSFGLGLHRKPRYIRHFEEDEYGRDHAFVAPDSVSDGLAVYSRGSGEPVLLFPYPHAHTTNPMAQEPLAELLVGMGRTVITFDVPGAYRSTREPVGDMEEMLRSADEALDRLGIEGPVDVVGHSMGSLCALAFAIDRPMSTNRLVLIGSVSGFPAAARWGMPGSVFGPADLDYWRIVVWGLKVKFGRGGLALHKQLQNLMEGASYHDKALFTPVEIEADDYDKGVPIREVLWGKNMYRRLSYADRLEAVRAPTLLLVGRYDPETPPACSEELLDGIADAKLVIFEESGHFPFIEESSLFEETVDGFLNASVELQQ